MIRKWALRGRTNIKSTSQARWGTRISRFMKRVLRKKDRRVKVMIYFDKVFLYTMSAHGNGHGRSRQNQLHDLKKCVHSLRNKDIVTWSLVHCWWNISNKFSIQWKHTHTHLDLGFPVLNFIKLDTVSVQLPSSGALKTTVKYKNFLTGHRQPPTEVCNVKPSVYVYFT